MTLFFSDSMWTNLLWMFFGGDALWSEGRINSLGTLDAPYHNFCTSVDFAELDRPCLQAIFVLLR